MNSGILESNYARVLERISAAAARAGRPAESVRLVAVTKTVTADVAGALIDLGAHDLGENRVQDLLEKEAALTGKAVRWHMIGHLQTNKVRKVMGRVALIHSVDSLRLAEEIESAAARLSVVQDALLEVNVSGEASKHGLAPSDAPGVAAALAAFSRVNVLGLMTMAPIVEDPEKTRPFFRRLRELADDIAARGFFASNRYELSMGMTQDFEVAIEEGATLIRVGSALVDGV